MMQRELSGVSWPGGKGSSAPRHTEQWGVAMTEADVSARTPSTKSSLDEFLLLIGLSMLPPLIFCVLVTGLWASYLLIHLLGMIGAWAICAAPLLIVRLVAKRRPGMVRRIINQCREPQRSHT
jgi:hypothetical protein